MRYKDYEVFDFLKDRFFMEWVKAPTPETDAFWKKWQEDHPDKVGVLENAKRLVKQFHYPEKKLPKSDANEILENIVHAIQGEKRAQRFPKVIHWHQSPFWKVAAVFIVGALMVLLWQKSFDFSTGSKKELAVSAPEPIVKSTAKGTKSSLRLPDGTRVILNAESKLTMPAKFETNARKVYLEGEAFFDVAEDTARPFTIVAGKVATTALGTAFNVKAYPDENNVQVALVSGKVRVDNIEENNPQKIVSSVILAPAESAEWNVAKEELVKGTFDEELITGWKDGWLIFKNQSFSEVKSKLERWYGVYMHVQRMPNQVNGFNGKFKKESLEEVLIVMSKVSDFQFAIQSDTVRIW